MTRSTWSAPAMRTPGWKLIFRVMAGSAFDPTPAAPAADPTGWSRPCSTSTRCASFWREWVVNYDVGHQYSLSRRSHAQRPGWLAACRAGPADSYAALVELPGERNRRWLEFACALERRGSDRAGPVAGSGGERWDGYGARCGAIIGRPSGEISAAGGNHLVRTNGCARSAAAAGASCRHRLRQEFVTSIADDTTPPAGHASPSTTSARASATPPGRRAPAVSSTKNFERSPPLNRVPPSPRRVPAISAEVLCELCD